MDREYTPEGTDDLLLHLEVCAVHWGGRLIKRLSEKHLNTLHRWHNMQLIELFNAKDPSNGDTISDLFVRLSPSAWDRVATLRKKVAEMAQEMNPFVLTKLERYEA